MKDSSKTLIKKSVTWLLRILTGATFVFSGFVKAIDPWGTLYKFQDYMGAMGLPSYDNLLLVGVFLLCTYEFCVGVFLLTGCFRRSAPIAGMLMMAVMLPLTLWIYISNPVPDCGCFGDAIILSNAATFWKNVVLVIFLAWLIKFNTLCHYLIQPLIQWIALVGSTAFVVVLGMIGYLYQPLIDFRPYAVGTVIADNLSLPENIDPTMGEGSSSEEFDISEDSDDIEASEDSDETDDMLFIYSKDGVEKSFGINDELPGEDEGWSFVRREYKSGASSKPTHTAKDDNSFQIWSEDGNAEVTQDVLLPRGGQLILLMPDLKNVSMAMTWRINSLNDWAESNDIDMIGVVAGTPQEIDSWKDISLASYPLYTAEDTSIKMIARGNPAVVYLYDGKIIWKSTLAALNTEDFLESGTSKNPADYARDDSGILKKVILCYLILLVLLIIVSITPSLTKIILKNAKK